MRRTAHAMEPLLLFALPALLLFAVQGSEFSAPSGWLTLLGLLAPLALRPGSVPQMPLRLLWIVSACISRLLLFLHLRLNSWDELSTVQGGLIAVAGISGALSAAGSELPSWTGRALFWPMLAGAFVAALFPFLPALPFAIGGLLWLGPLMWTDTPAAERSSPLRGALLGSCLGGIAIGFPIFDGSLMSWPETSALALALVATALITRLPRAIDFSTLDLLPPILAAAVILIPQAALSPAWPILVGLGMARILVRPHQPRTVLPAASFIIGIAIAYAFVSQQMTAYLVGVLALSEMLRIYLETRATRAPRPESASETGAVADTPSIDLQES